MKILRRLSVSKQVAILCVGFVVPLAVVLTILIGKYTQELEFTRQEIRGMTVIAPLHDLALITLRDQAAGQDRATPLDPVLKAVDATGEGGLLTAEARQALMQAYAGADTAPARLAALTQAIVSIADRSNLTLDPQVQTYYAMDIFINGMLSLSQTLGGIRQAALLPPPEAVRGLGMAHGALLSDLARLETGLRNGRTPDSADVYDGLLTAAFRPLLESSRPLAAAVGRADAAGLAQVSGQGAAVVPQAVAAWEAAEKALSTLLERRLQAVQSEFRQTVGLCVGLVLLSLLLAALIARGVSGFLGQLQVWLRGIASGQGADLTGWDADRTETGQAVATVARLEAEVQQAFVLRQMVEGMSACVMTCDVGTLSVRYLNPAAQGMLDRLRQDSGGAALPPDLTDRALSDLYRFDADQRQRLQTGDGLPARWRVPLGARVFQVLASPVRDRHGVLGQVMLTWTDVTDQIRLADRFEASVKRIVDTVATGIGAVDSGSHRLHVTAGQAADRSAAALETTHEVNAAVQTAAAAVEELSASIQEITNRVTRAAEVASDATQEAGQTVGVMAGMQSAADRISEVVSLISMIADQTNLLALNATIEAARAGDSGKGFAVVANEVKALATQTGKATAEIGQQIAAMQRATQASAQAIDHISTIIGTIDQMTGDIAAAVEQQNAATHEISRNMAGVAQGSQKTARHMDALRQSADSTSGEADALRTVSETLSVQARSLSEEVDSFLASVRV